MSHIGPRDRDFLIPPPPQQIGVKITTEAWPLAPRFTPTKSSIGPVQEAVRVGFVALSLSWVAAEIAFLLWG